MTWKAAQGGSLPRPEWEPLGLQPARPPPLTHISLKTVKAPVAGSREEAAARPPSSHCPALGRSSVLRLGGGCGGELCPGARHRCRGAVPRGRLLGCFPHSRVRKARPALAPCQEREDCVLWEGEVEAEPPAALLRGGAWWGDSSRGCRAKGIWGCGARGPGFVYLFLGCFPKRWRPFPGYNFLILLRV